MAVYCFIVIICKEFFGFVFFNFLIQVYYCIEVCVWIKIKVGIVFGIFVVFQVGMFVSFWYDFIQFSGCFQ